MELEADDLGGEAEFIRRFGVCGRRASGWLRGVRRSCRRWRGEKQEGEAAMTVSRMAWAMVAGKDMGLALGGWSVSFVEIVG